MIYYLQLFLFILGISFILIFYFPKNKESNAGIILIIISGLLLRIMVSLDPCLHDWDEKFHALVSKNLLHEFFKPMLYNETPLPYYFQNWTANHVWLHKQPLPLWLISLSLRFFGNVAIAVRIPSILLSTFTIYLTYKIGCLLFTKREALWASSFVSINGFIIEFCGGRIATDHVDTIFFFFILLGIYSTLYFKDQDQKPTIKLFSSVVLIGLITGCAILCKWLTGFIILPLCIYVNLNKPLFFQKISVCILTACLVFVPWQIYAAMKFPNEFWYEMHLNSLHFNSIIEGHGHSWFFYLNQARINWNELIYLPLGWLLYEVIWKRTKNQSIIFLFLWIAIPYVIFSIAKTKMPGYTLFTAPAFFLIASYFIFNILEVFNKNMRTVVLVLFTLLCLRYCIERVKPFQNNVDCPASAKLIDNIDQFLKVNFPGKRVVIYSNDLNIDIMFFTGYLSYPHLPDIDEIKKFQADDYIVLIVGENIPKDIKEIPGLLIYNTLTQHLD